MGLAQPESKYSTSSPDSGHRCFGWLVLMKTLMQSITALFLLFHSAFFFTCIFLFFVCIVLSCPSLCSLSFPSHFPCVSFLYLSCLEQVERAAGSSLCVGPFRNLMVSAHVYLPGSQRTLVGTSSGHLRPHR